MDRAGTDPDSAAAPAVDPSMAYALCAYVDGALPAPPSGWKEIWAPARGDRENYAKVLQSDHRPQLFALAIQGTHNVLDLLEDFEIVPQVEFPPIAGAHIATGSHRGLHLLLELEMVQEETTEKLGSILAALPEGSALLVTGHSLGGNLSSVMAPWIAANVAVFGGKQQPLQKLPANLSAITFAAPTAGDAAFAQFLDANPANYQAFFNQNDVVSNVWAESGPLQIDNIDVLFPPPGPQPPPLFVQDLLRKKIQLMAEANPPVSYTQTNGAIFQFPPGQAPAGFSEPWIWELGYEHNYAYCVQFLGKHGHCTPPASDA